MSVPTNTYACADGYVYVAMILDSHWRKLCDLMGRPELGTPPGLATNAERMVNRDEANGAVQDWCADRSVDEVLRVC